MLPNTTEIDTYVALKCKYSSSIDRKDEESREFFKFLGKLHFDNFFINQRPSYKDMPWNDKNENPTSQ